jgi:hypothetical protein
MSALKDLFAAVAVITVPIIIYLLKFVKNAAILVLESSKVVPKHRHTLGDTELVPLDLSSPSEPLLSGSDKKEPAE